MKEKLFHKDFTLVVIGQIISLFGNAILRFALPLYLLRETGSAALFGVVSACSFLPMIVLSFLGGILADRVNKRNIMVCLDFATALLILVLYGVLGKVPIVPLFLLVLMLLYGISGAYQPTVQASIPALVAQDQILSAGAVVNQIGSLAGLLGPTIGGILFGAFGIRPILVISVLCFLASAIMEVFIHIPYERRPADMGVLAIIRSDFHESARYLRREKPVLLKIMGIIALFNLVLTAMLIVGMPVLIVDTLQLSDELLGFTQGALALGGLCGGVITAVLGKKLKLQSACQLLLLCAFGVGVMAAPLVAGAASLVSYAVLTAAGFVIMGLCTMFSVQMLATVQTETPPALVGKVIALMIAISLCAQPIGQALYGVIFDLFPGNTGEILLVVALLALVISLASRKIFDRVVTAPQPT